MSGHVFPCLISPRSVSSFVRSGIRGVGTVVRLKNVSSAARGGMSSVIRGGVGLAVELCRFYGGGRVQFVCTSSTSACKSKKGKCVSSSSVRCLGRLSPLGPCT